MSARDEIAGLIAGSNESIRPIAERIADGILARHAREVAAKVLEEFYLPGDGSSGLVKEIVSKIEPKG